MMKYHKFHNCLRIQITPDDMQDERIETLVSHCIQYGFDNVMLMLNLEEFFAGHLSVEELKPWVAVMKKAKKKLEEHGVTVSVNNWLVMGHADRGRCFLENQNFMPLTDMNGRKSAVQACPMGKKWREYFADYVSFLVRELKPDTYWIEDDFRLHNHEPLEGIGCYCEEHMAYYNEKLNVNYTREEFVKKIFEKGPCNPERKVWLDANREVMLSLAEWIVRAVKAGNPETDVALMSSLPGNHCIEGRDWKKLCNILGEGGNRINRIHLGYWETCGKDMLYYFNAGAMAVRAMMEDDVIIMPEMENGPASVYSRSPRYLRFMMEMAIPLVLSGMTYSIYDFVGNGVRETFGYGQEVSKIRPYMQAIQDLRLQYSTLAGVIIPIDQKASYYKTIEKDYKDLIPTEYEAAAYLSGLGLSFCYSQKKEFAEETLFLTGSSVDYFTDEQLRALFAENFVMLDGSGVLALQKRELLSLIHAKTARKVEPESGYQTYEECADENLEICGVRNLRASCRKSAGDFVKVDYDNTVKVHTHVYNHFRERLAPAFVSGRGFSVTPYCLTEQLRIQFCDLRRYFVTETLVAHASRYALCDIPGVSPYLYQQPDASVLILLNGNADTYPEIPLRLGGVSFNKISVLDKKGEVLMIPFETQGDFVVVKMELEYLASTVLILE